MKAEHHLAVRSLFGYTAFALAVSTLAVAGGDPNRVAYFGQTHSHTSWSIDAYLIGNHLAGPEEAYQYSLGMPVKHPMGFEVRLRGRPLDFHGVTDHSEYVGVIALANDPKSDFSKLPIAQKLLVKTPEDFNRVFKWIAGSLSGKPIEALVDPKIASSIWQHNIAIADKYYKPGQFTTFVAYEWTSAPNNQNMHRNVFFRDSKKVPAFPFSALDSGKPEELWGWMDSQRKQGNEVLAISHNANLSNGQMFPVDVDDRGRPIDAAWAQTRMRNEFLTEIHQVKGSSETHPELSPTDEFANYEIMNFLLGLDNSTSRLNGSYIRQAWQNGMALQEALGVNPYKMGVVGASDSHNAVIPYAQSNNFGTHGFTDSTPALRLSGKANSGMAALQTGTSGLAGVWAEENTRESIFDAMKRKEVFGTSGVRISVRLFGGWVFDNTVWEEKDWVHTAYAKGVPMGGDLPEKQGRLAPTFVVWAVKDADEANLDRIQIVKGWTESGQTFEKIYDVAWSGERLADPATGKVPAVGSTVDVSKATYTDTIGATELKTVWIDPDFDPAQNAFYYARVLQIPTPRWSTYDAATLQVLPPASVPATVQERAWTTPIWYSPDVQYSKLADYGKTVEAIKREGAKPLTQEQLQTYVVGKTLKVRNTVTDQTFEMFYGADGQRSVISVDGKPPAQGEYLNMLHGGQFGVPARYEVKDGYLLTTLGGSPFEVMVFEQNGKYIAARNSEFGYANYEVEEVKLP